MNKSDQDAIRKNTVELVEKMELKDVLDHLIQRRTITRAHYEELMPAHKSERRDKVRDFLGVISRRGSTAFNDLCEVLIDTSQEHLAELLCPGKALKSVEKGSTNPQQLSISSPEIELSSDMIISTPLTPVTQEKIQEYLRLVDKNAYKMTNPRGRALIINNEDFSTSSLSNRSGSVEDVMNLSALFDELQLNTTSEINKTAQEMQDIIKSETEDGAHRNYGMFVLVILSHGENGAVYGVDGKLLSIHYIKQLLGSKRFSSMAGKPKLILLQACQGGGAVGDDKLDGAEVDAVPGGNDAPRAEFADILVAYPTGQGQMSYRHTETGSWFIRAIVEVFRRNSHKDHVLEMLTQVRRVVDRESSQNNSPQGTYDENHLYKFLYLLPGWSG